MTSDSDCDASDEMSEGSDRSSVQPASDVSGCSGSSCYYSESVQQVSDNDSLYANPAGLGYDSDSNNAPHSGSPSVSHASTDTQSSSASMAGSNVQGVPTTDSDVPMDPELEIQLHPLLDGTPCDVNGFDLPLGANPVLQDEDDLDDFSPFSSRAEFEFAEFIFTEEQMSAGKLDKHLNNLAELYPDSSPPFSNHQEMYSTIDSITVGEVPWQSFSVSYNGEIPEDAPPWMTASYEVWHHDSLLVLEQQLGNKDFDGQMDFAPKRIFQDGKCQYTDLMSGNWA
jgi:Plavaka transposase